MGAHPAATEVRLDAAIGVVEREHLAGVVVDVGIGAGERAVARHLAGQPIDAAVVVGAAAAVARVSVVRICGVWTPPGA
jgi:hypothetical protein